MKRKLKVLLLLTTLVINGCATSSKSSNIPYGPRLPEKLPTLNIEKLPIKLENRSVLPSDQKIMSKYFHYEGDFPSMSYPYLLGQQTKPNKPKSDNKYVTVEHYYNLDKDLTIKGKNSKSLSVNINLKQSASLKLNIFQPSVNQEMNKFLGDTHKIINHNFLMLTLEKLDKLRPELEKLAKEN